MPDPTTEDFRIESRYVQDRFHRRGFDVRWCCPGEGAVDLRSLVGALTGQDADEPHLLPVEGLDNHPDAADRLVASLARADRCPGGRAGRRRCAVRVGRWPRRAG